MIETTEQYEAALRELERLMDLDPEPETEAAREFNRLADEIGAYERKVFLSDDTFKKETG